MNAADQNAPTEEMARIVTGCSSEENKLKNCISTVSLQNKGVKMCIPLLGKFFTHVHDKVHSSIAWNNTKLQTAHVSINRRMEFLYMMKQSQCGILYSRRKQINYNYMDES